MPTFNGSIFKSAMLQTLRELHRGGKRMKMQQQKCMQQHCLVLTCLAARGLGTHACSAIHCTVTASVDHFLLLTIT